MTPGGAHRAPPTRDDVPRVAQADAWPDEWDVVPADRGRGVFRIDVDGRWYHDGIAITQGALVRLFADHMLRDDNGEWILRWGPYDHPVTVADTPAVIRRAEPPGADGRFAVHLVDGRTVTLAVDSIAVGAANVPYARMPDAEWVRFSRTAYYQIAEHVRERGDGFAVVVGDRQWNIGRRND